MNNICLMLNRHNQDNNIKVNLLIKIENAIKIYFQLRHQLFSTQLTL